jgi:Type IV secretion-system coupling protein DNA-binding domain
MGEFDGLLLSLKQQIIQPVTSKAHRFEEEPALWLFSPPQSTLSLKDVINKRKILILSTHQLSLGDDLAGFIGALVINFAIRALGDQENLPEEQRVPLYLIADEFQSIPCVRWEVFLQQIRKLGGVPGLGTQSLSSLRKFDQFLPSIIFSGIQTLVSYQVTGEDAKELSEREFARSAGGPGMESLLNLDPHQAWIRTIDKDKRPLRPFLVNMRKPFVPNESMIAQVLARRHEYSIPFEQAKQQAKANLKNWMQTYNINGIVSDGGSTTLQSKSFPAEGAPADSVPHYVNRPSALTAYLPEGLHDIIAAPQPRARREAKAMPYQPSSPDTEYLKTALPGRADTV